MGESSRLDLCMDTLLGTKRSTNSNMVNMSFCQFAKAFLKMIVLFPSSFWLLLLICWPFGPLHSSFCWRLINILYINYIVFCALVILTFLNVHSTLYRCYTHWIFLPTQQSNFTFKVRSAGRSILSLRSSCSKLLLITAQCWLIHCMVHGVKSMSKQ